MPRRDETDLGEAGEYVMGALDPDSADVLRTYLAEPLASVDLLEERTHAYLKDLEAYAAEGRVLDLEQAGEIAVWCERLLGEIGDETPEEHRRLIQAGVRYFVSSDDSDGDLDSLVGLDDDRAVVEAIAIAVGCGHVLEDE